MEDYSLFMQSIAVDNCFFIMILINSYQYNLITTHNPVFQDGKFHSRIINVTKMYQVNLIALSTLTRTPKEQSVQSAVPLRLTALRNFIRNILMVLFYRI